MHLRHLNIRNLKLLRDFRVSFSRGDESRPWTVFVGENGFCKTSILRAIALAASGHDRANQLAQNFIPSMQDKREGAGAVEFSASFSFPKDDVGLHAARQYPELPTHPPSAPFVQSIFSARQTVLEGTSLYTGPDGGAFPGDPGVPNPLETARADDLPLWFTAAYGVGRSLPDPQSTTNRSFIRSLERMRSLFDGAPLIATDFASRFEPELARAFAKELKKAFVDHHLLPEVVDVELRGRGGVFDGRTLVESQRFAFQFKTGPELRLPAVWLSHGYQSTIAWIADLVGQVWMEAGTFVPLQEIEGLVLIDELDLHLHPTWQRGLVSMLKETFPLVQFIATTHSPMVLPGLDADEIFVLKQDDEGSITAEQATQNPTLMTGGQLYRSFFDIDSLYPSEIGRKHDEYVYLAANAFRTQADDTRARELLVQLRAANADPGFEPVPRRG